MNKIFVRLSLQEQVFFAKRLSILVKAGVPLLSGLQMLNRQTSSRSIKKILKDVIQDVENGQFLSASLARYKKVFGEFAINIIEIGEVSGTLPENLNYLAEELKKKQLLRRKVISALIYPAIIVVATFGITLLLTVYIFPKLMPIFRSVEFDLPLTTKIIIFSSSLLLNYGIYFLFGFLAIISAIFFLLRVEKIRLKYHQLLISLPIFGRLVQSYQMSNLCRTMGLLLRSEVMIVKSAMITANTTTNLAYRRELLHIAEAVTMGEKISVHMNKNTRLFPPVSADLITVGETTGKLSDTLLYLGDMYESEVDEQTKNLSTILEPALMLLMGLIVGFVAISIITPIYEVTQHLHP